MARLNTRTSATPINRASTVDSLYRDPTPLSQVNGSSTAQRSSYSVMSPALSQHSDKENEFPSSQPETPRIHAKHKGKGKTMARNRAQRPPTPDPESGSTPSSNSNKRRRTGNYTLGTSDMENSDIYQDEDEEDVEDDEELNDADAPPTPEDDEEDESLRYYNPNQDPNKRRAVIVGITKHGREIADNYDELVNGAGDEIIRHVDKLNIHMGKVRQTADAAKDSRLLGTMADIAGKALNIKTQTRPGVGVDLDQFVSRCIYFMREGHAPDADEVAPTQASNRRRTRHVEVDEDEDEDETGEGLDWALLGREVCFPSNRRPPTSNFLLGPLSVQKRARTVMRRARNQRQALGPATRPQELRQEDIRQSENTNLTHLVSIISERLKSHITMGETKIEEELTELGEDQDEDDFNAACCRHRVYQTPDQEGAVALFDFVVNPNSFGQTVENIFYVSFLIREGRAKVLVDEEALPLLVPATSRNVEEQRQQNVEKHQAIFSLDYKTWQDLIVAYDITESLIPHRENEEANVAPGGWYG